MRTAKDVRSYFLSRWREVLPDLLVSTSRVSPRKEDNALVCVKLVEEDGPIRELVLVPLSSGEPRIVRSLLPRLRDLAEPSTTWAGILVPHMGAAGLRLCREAGIGFVDCCGNAFLRFNRVVIQITGNRNRFAARKRIRTLFNDKATIPLRILLNAPERWLTTREIADAGGLSLGWVSHILQQMNADGYVSRKRGGGTRLTDASRLLDDWLQEYAFGLNELYPFQIQTKGLQETLQRLRVLKAPLADRYALTLNGAIHTLRGPSPQRPLPFDLHVYLPELATDRSGTLEAWRKALDLRPAGLGANCFLVKPAYPQAIFFGREAGFGLRRVSDLQLYLDLYHYPGRGRKRDRNAVRKRLPFDLSANAR